MKVKALLLMVSSPFLFFPLLYTMEENNLPELPLLEEIALLHSPTPSFLDTGTLNPTIEQEMQPISGLDEKQSTHIVKKPHICPYCTTSFKYISQLKVHERKHTLEKPFICKYPNCNYSAARRDSLTIHMLAHTGKKPYQCGYPNCDYSSTRKNDFIVHQKRIHTGEKSFICNYPNCNKAFISNFELNSHQRTHTGEKPYQCNYQNCGETFTWLKVLKNHQKKHSLELDTAIIVATKKARLNSNSSDSYEEKIDAEKSYQCDYPDCGYTSVQKSDLILHQRIHTGLKPFICNYPKCNHTFVRNSHLIQHQRIHTGDTLYICDYPNCGQTFTCQRAFVRHQNKHSLKCNAISIAATKKAKLTTNNFDNSGEKHED